MKIIQYLDFWIIQLYSLHHLVNILKAYQTSRWQFSPILYFLFDKFLPTVVIKLIHKFHNMFHFSKLLCFINVIFDLKILYDYEKLFHLLFYFLIKDIAIELGFGIKTSKFWIHTSFIISSNCCFCIGLIRENEGSISMIRLDNDNEPSHFVDAEINSTFNFYKPH